MSWETTKCSGPFIQVSPNKHLIQIQWLNIKNYINNLTDDDDDDDDDDDNDDKDEDDMDNDEDADDDSNNNADGNDENGTSIRAWL